MGDVKAGEPFGIDANVLAKIDWDLALRGLATISARISSIRRIWVSSTARQARNGSPRSMAL
jgi:hypothetical protein